MTTSNHSTSSSEADCKRCYFEGLIIPLHDGSQWQIGKPLSKPKYQTSHAPCEATQVFTCTCVDDPLGTYIKAPEAVVKVKYQVTMDPDELQDWVVLWNNKKRTILDKCACSSEPSRCVRCQEIQESYIKLFHTAQNAADYPNEDTINEINALDLLRKAQCPYTPWIIGIQSTVLEPEADEPELDNQAIVGGFCWFIVMTKVPGEPLSKTFTQMPKAKRDQVHKAFNKAWTAVRRLGICHGDEALRNLMWDEKEGKCYIIDFERYEYSDPKQWSVDECKETEFESWYWQPGGLKLASN